MKTHQVSGSVLEAVEGGLTLSITRDFATRRVKVLLSDSQLGGMRAGAWAESELIDHESRTEAVLASLIHECSEMYRAKGQSLETGEVK